ncbi:MAG: SRPBCC domain-containing protein, partial [Hyphomonadaceae bacterium]
MELGRIIAPDTFVLERRLKAPIERVWSYFVDADKRSLWFNAGDDLIAEGQNFVFSFGHHRITNEKPPERWKQMESGEMIMNGRVLAFDPPRLLTITWGGQGEADFEVRFVFTALGDETLLRITHVKIGSIENLRDYAGGWTAHLQALADVLEGKPT